jgi:hypothetical protein
VFAELLITRLISVYRYLYKVIFKQIIWYSFSFLSDLAVIFHICKDTELCLPQVTCIISLNIFQKIFNTA